MTCSNVNTGKLRKDNSSKQSNRSSTNKSKQKLATCYTSAQFSLGQNNGQFPPNTPNAMERYSVYVDTTITLLTS